MKVKFFILALFLAATASHCDKEDDMSSPEVDGTDAYIFHPELMNNSNLLEEVSLVEATLTDGTTAQCYKLVFKSNPVADGPYCPETIDDIGGVGIYDGATNPGFQVMKAALWNAMEADGYDIVDADGNINISDPASGVMPGGGTASGSCLEATPNNNIQLTFLIPAEPQLASSNDVIDIVENFGVSKDGIPLTGHPPSATQGPPGPAGPPAGASPVAGIPAIDPCGGHIDPFGYYHLHFGAEEMNNVLAANGMTEVSCTNFEQDQTAFIGYAKDGFPVYASRDQDGTLPFDLDDCQGHTAATADYPDGVYHYHVSDSQAPNLPQCIKGLSVRNGFTYE